MLKLSSRAGRRGFTIIELLIVIVVIAILATITIIAYSGIQQRATTTSLKSNLSQISKALELHKVGNSEAYPASLESANIKTPATGSYSYNATNTTYCLSATERGISYKITHTTPTPTEGTCSGVLADGTTCPTGFIAVPGNSTFSTTDFCVMKYEAKNGGSNTPVSTPTGNPWVSISQTNAITYSPNACDGEHTGCHLITEAEWMTIAANVLSVPGNWSGGAVGSGYIYNGHVSNSPAGALEASADDTDSLYGITGGTGNGSQYNNKRTLTLTNGEVIWDFAGNVYEWTNATITGGQQPGLAGESAYAWKQWNNSSLQFNGLPSLSRPGTISPQAATWSSTNGIGQLFSNTGETGVRAFLRGGNWAGGSYAGVLSLNLYGSSGYAHAGVGFRVAR